MDRFNQPLVAAFSATLRASREKAGLTQEALAERADISTRFVSLLETGRRQPSLSTLHALSSALGLPMSHLTKATEERLTEAADFSRAKPE